MESKSNEGFIQNNVAKLRSFTTMVKSTKIGEKRNSDMNKSEI